MQTIRWGIIGVGRFGRIHAKTIQSLPGSELVAISNRNRERLSSAVEEFGVLEAYQDYRELLEDGGIDAVSITTHWQQHFEVASAALTSGKHVLLEKPMASTSDQCNELVRVASSAQGVFMVGHICRFDPRVSLAKKAVDQGRIGRIVSMHAKRNLPKAPGNIRLDKISPLMGDGVHDADLMMWFLGRAPTHVYGRNIHFGGHRYPDVGWAMLQFADDAIGVVESNWGLPNDVPTVIDAKLEVIGTDGMLTIDCANTGLMILDSEVYKAVDTDYWPEQHGTIVGAIVNEFAYFTDCIRQGTAPKVVTAQDAALAVRVMEAAEQSAETGNPIELTA